MCYSQGEGLNTSLSRLFYLVLYTVVELLSGCCSVVHKYPMCWTLTTSSTIGEGRECNKFVPVLVGNGTKISPTGDIFDQPPGQM